MDTHFIEHVAGKIGYTDFNRFRTAKSVSIGLGRWFVPEPKPNHGAPGGIRTPDQWLRKPLLYPAELRARFQGKFFAGSGDF